jgi:hypothetical protein
MVWDPDYLATDTKQVLGLLHMYLSTEQQIPFDYRPFRICHNDGLSRTAFDLFESDTVARVWKYAKVRDESIFHRAREHVDVYQMATAAGNVPAMYTAYFVSAIRDSRDVEPKIIDVRRLDRGNDQWASHFDRLADCYLVMYVQTITATPMTHLAEVQEMQVINILCAYVKLRRKGVRHSNLTPSSMAVSNDGAILVTDVSRALIVSRPNSKDARREWYPQEVSDVAQGLAETIEDEMVAMDTTEKIKLRNYLLSDKMRDLFLVLDG